VIRIILRGRTGNNLFQYALGRALAVKHGVPLVLDGSWYNTKGWAEVSHFLKLPLQAKVLRPPIVVSLAARALRNSMGKHIWEYRGVPVFKESIEDQSFNPKIADAPADCMLSGFFQSPLYFQSIASELRAELRELIPRGVYASPLQVDKACGSSLKARLALPGSVAVHVRRGDYLQIPAFQVCDSAYYQTSMNRMRGQLGNPHFFIFTDDPEWCRRKFNASDTEIIDSGAAATNPLHDLHLMSQASHHIIANSSYSWWAAWIGDKPGQQVIMPDRWFTNGIKAPMEQKRWK